MEATVQQASARANSSSLLLRFVEIWTPQGDDGKLRLHSALHGDYYEFGRISRTIAFGTGEGLPGRVWSDCSPVIFENFTDKDFLRANDARRIGLTTAIGLPIFRCGEIHAVVTMLFDEAHGNTGCVEIWRHATERDELVLREGYYVNLQRFSLLSQFIRFPFGIGLPGRAWEARRPLLLDRLAHSTEFIRASGAESAGLNVGLAIPVFAEGGRLDSVFTMLSSSVSPLAKVFEVWQPTINDDIVLQRISQAGLPTNRHVKIDLESFLGRIATTGLPAVTEALTADTHPEVDILERLGCTRGFALPIFDGVRLAAVVSMFG